MGQAGQQRRVDKAGWRGGCIPNLGIFLFFHLWIGPVTHSVVSLRLSFPFGSRFRMASVQAFGFGMEIEQDAVAQNGTGQFADVL